MPGPGVELRPARRRSAGATLYLVRSQKSSWTRQSGHDGAHSSYHGAIENRLRGDPRARGGNKMAFPPQPGIFNHRHSMLIHKISPRLLERRPVLFLEHRGVIWRPPPSIIPSNFELSAAPTATTARPTPRETVLLLVFFFEHCLFVWPVGSPVSLSPA